MLHLVELPLDLRALHAWAAHRGLGRSGTLDEGHALHHLLGETFGPAALQPFRLMVAPRARSGTLYAYSDRPAESIVADAASIIAPSEAAVIALGRLRSLPRPPENWRMGQRLGFDVRLRPVVRLASDLPGRDGVLSKGSEIDAWLAEALRTDAPHPRETVYLDWLATRLAPAASVDPVVTRMASFDRSRIRRGKESLDGPDVTVHGTLTIEDPQSFAGLLARGVGRHKAYGYGMLLLRPPQKAD